MKRDKPPVLKTAGSFKSVPLVIFPFSMVYQEHPLVNGSTSELLSTCQRTITFSPASILSSTIKANDAGIASAQMFRCFSRASFPENGTGNAVSSYSTSCAKTDTACFISLWFHASKYCSGKLNGVNDLDVDVGRDSIDCMEESSSVVESFFVTPMTSEASLRIFKLDSPDLSFSFTTNALRINPASFNSKNAAPFFCAPPPL
mmetsp:Transcript_2469/g.5391  ORF Transcript_2469/g.5391 Transcript_2469/m.5391 type:complete len:203 (-) Transcript_2469:799-1407(-)